MPTARRFLTGAATAAAVYGCWVRPRLMCWGATDEEVSGPFPGADLVPQGKRSGTSAVTIQATPEQVWPWLVQMGWDRGGWYSWDLLDNAGRPSATRVHPEWQNLAVGDRLKFWALGHVADAYRVAVIEPNIFLGLYGCSDLAGRWLDPQQPHPASYMEGIWGFHLRELPDGGTRLVISGYQVYRPRWLERIYAEWFMLPVSWIMTARMLVVLKRNVERAVGAEEAAQTARTGGPARSESLSAAS